MRPLGRERNGTYHAGAMEQMRRTVLEDVNERLLPRVLVQQLAADQRPIALRQHPRRAGQAEAADL